MGGHSEAVVSLVWQRKKVPKTILPRPTEMRRRTFAINHSHNDQEHQQYGARGGGRMGPFERTARLGVCQYADLPSGPTASLS
jgi:hypothetical protein